jgi:molecular chaperone HtpG
MIMEKCAELVPDYFSFVKGVVDSDDLSLNISRELLQHDRQLLAIAQRLEKKIDQELKKMIVGDRENYEKLFANFGLQFKYGIYEGYGQNKDKLKDYLVYRSSAQKEDEKKMTTISEYVSRMKEDQKYIYYAIAETAEKAARLPGAESLKDAGYEILYMTDDIDDFVMKILANYDGKEFKSVTAGDLEAPEKDGETEKVSEENKGVLDALKTALDGKVSDVRFSSRLKETPVIIVSGDGLSLEMEKVLAKQPGADAAGLGALKAKRILEINPKHAIVAKLKDAAGDEKLMAKYANILYAQALLIEGLEVDDPVALANDVLELV